MLNQCNFIGRLGRDPEMRRTQTGKPVASFSIACDEGKGEQKRTEWVNVVAWERLAEICGDYLRKGALVFISGRMQTRSWEKDGVTRYTTEIVAREMKMLGGGRENDNAGRPQQSGPPPGRTQQSLLPQGDDRRHQPPGYDDVPF